MNAPFTEFKPATLFRSEETMTGTLRRHWPMACIAFGSLLVVASWLIAYPITPTGVQTWWQFPVFYWLGLAAALVGAGRLAFSSRLSEQMASVLTVGLAAASPQVFYFVSMADTVAQLPFLRNLLAVTHIDFGAERRLQWPAMPIWAKSVILAGGLEPEGMLKVGLVLFVVVFMLGGLWLYRQSGQTRYPALATTLPFIAAFLVFNWQYAYQPPAFALMLVAAALVTGTRTAGRLACAFLISLFIVFTHAFVGIWFMGALVIMVLVEQRPRRTGKTPRPIWLSFSIRVAFILLLMQVAYLMYVSQFEFNLFAKTLQGFSTVYRNEAELTNVQLGTYANGALRFSEGPILLAIKVMALVSMVTAAGLLALGAYYRRQREWRSVKGSLYLGFIGTGALHFIAGLAVEILGTRGMQLMAMGAAYGTGGLERLNAQAGRAVRVLAMLSFAFFAASIFRTQVDFRNVLTPGSDEFLTRLTDRLTAVNPPEVTGETMYVYQMPHRSKDVLPQLDWRGPKTMDNSKNVCAIELANVPIKELQALNLVVDRGTLRLYCKPR